LIRLVRAELRKAVRPIVGAVAIGLMLAAAVFAWQQQGGAQQQVGFVYSNASTPEGIAQSAGPPQIPSCSSVGLPPGPQCDQLIARAREAYQNEINAMKAQAAAAKLLVQLAVVQQNPAGAGLMAASLMASVVGAIAIFLLAAAHFGGEWTGGTMAAVLSQDGRRWRLVAGKFVSLFLLAQGLLLVTWVFLAALSLLFRAAYPLNWPSPLSIGDGFAIAGPAVLRSCLVTAAYCALGVLAAVMTRNTLGTLLLATGGLLAWLMLETLPSIAALSIGYWISGWMGFTDAGFSSGQVMWGVPPGMTPSATIGFLALLALIPAAGAISAARFQRLDIAA